MGNCLCGGGKDEEGATDRRQQKQKQEARQSPYASAAEQQQQQPGADSASAGCGGSGGELADAPEVSEQINDPPSSVFSESSSLPDDAPQLHDVEQKPEYSPRSADHTTADSSSAAAAGDLDEEDISGEDTDINPPPPPSAADVTGVEKAVCERHEEDELKDTTAGRQEQQDQNQYSGDQRDNSGSHSTDSLQTPRSERSLRSSADNSISSADGLLPAVGQQPSPASAAHRPPTKQENEAKPPISPFSGETNPPDSQPITPISALEDSWRTHPYVPHPVTSFSASNE